MSVDLDPLPYDKNVLEPYISEETFTFHHEKHHKGYVDNLNKLITGTKFENLELKNIILNTYQKVEFISIFNNAAQVWNHNFYFNSIHPNGGDLPSGDLMDKIKETFGSFDLFKQELKNLSISQFGSGWIWIVVDKNKKLSITKTSNAETPICQDLKPLITIDVWEHAYYLDYQNRRADYVDVFISKLINWNFALKNLQNNE